VTLSWYNRSRERIPPLNHNAASSIPILIKSIPLNSILFLLLFYLYFNFSSPLFPRVFPTEILYACRNFPIRSTCPKTLLTAIKRIIIKFPTSLKSSDPRSEYCTYKLDTLETFKTRSMFLSKQRKKQIYIIWTYSILLKRERLVYVEDYVSVKSFSNSNKNSHYGASCFLREWHLSAVDVKQCSMSVRVQDVGQLLRFSPNQRVLCKYCTRNNTLYVSATYIQYSFLSDRFASKYVYVHK
jgi:hypothetical protein